MEDYFEADVYIAPNLAKNSSNSDQSNNLSCYIVEKEQMLGVRYKDSKTPIGRTVVGTSQQMVQHKEEIKERAK